MMLMDTGMKSRNKIPKAGHLNILGIINHTDFKNFVA